MFDLRCVEVWQQFAFSSKKTITPLYLPRCGHFIGISHGRPVVAFGVPYCCLLYIVSNLRISIASTFSPQHFSNTLSRARFQHVQLIITQL